MYRLRETGAVMFEGELRAHLLANDGPSFGALTPEVMEAIGVDPVLEGPQPTLTRYQTSQRDGVEQVDGKWFTRYIAVDMAPEAVAALDTQQADSMRTQRNDKLAESDWTQLTDAPLTPEVKTAWATYRQALRDVPSQAGFPWDVTWPTEP